MWLRGGNGRCLKWTKRQAEGPLPSLPLVRPITCSSSQSRCLSAAAATGALGPLSIIFLRRWCLGTQEEKQPSGIVLVLAAPKNTM